MKDEVELRLSWAPRRSNLGRKRACEIGFGKQVATARVDRVDHGTQHRGVDV